MFSMHSNMRVLGWCLRETQTSSSYSLAISNTLRPLTLQQKSGNGFLVRDALIEDKFVTIWLDYPCLYMSGQLILETGICVNRPWKPQSCRFQYLSSPVTIRSGCADFKKRSEKLYPKCRQQDKLANSITCR